MQMQDPLYFLKLASKNIQWSNQIREHRFNLELGWFLLDGS